MIRSRRSLTNVMLAAAMVMLCLLPAAMGFQQLSTGPKERVDISYDPSCVDGSQGNAVSQNCCIPGSIAVISDPTDPGPVADNLIEEVLNPDQK